MANNTAEILLPQPGGNDADIASTAADRLKPGTGENFPEVSKEFQWLIEQILADAARREESISQQVDSLKAEISTLTSTVQELLGKVEGQTPQPANDTPSEPSEPVEAPQSPTPDEVKAVLSDTTENEPTPEKSPKKRYFDRDTNKWVRGWFVSGSDDPLNGTAVIDTGRKQVTIRQNIQNNATAEKSLRNWRARDKAGSVQQEKPESTPPTEPLPPPPSEAEPEPFQQPTPEEGASSESGSPAEPEAFPAPETKPSEDLTIESQHFKSGDIVIIPRSNGGESKGQVQWIYEKDGEEWGVVKWLEKTMKKGKQVLSSQLDLVSSVEGGERSGQAFSIGDIVRGNFSDDGVEEATVVDVNEESGTVYVEWTGPVYKQKTILTKYLKPAE